MPNKKVSSQSPIAKSQKSAGTKSPNKNFIQLPAELSSADAKLLHHIISDHPEVHFRTGARFSYRPPRTIILGDYEPNYLLLFLHELGHATIHRDNYHTLIVRLKIERAAWDQAERLAAKYHINWNPDFVESQLDTYRDWLHAKARCPHCGQTRYQTPDGVFHCSYCDTFCVSRTK